MCSVYPPFCLFAGGRGVEPPTKFLKSGGLAGFQFLEGVAGKEGRVCSFYIKNILKFEIFNKKKSLYQKFFSLP